MPGTSNKRRIVIVDDHPLVRRGLIALINGEPDLTVCAEAADHRTGLEVIASSEPDLIITDLSLEDGGGLAMVGEVVLHHAGLPVLVLTMHDAPAYVRRAFVAGASGYVNKQEMTETLLIAIRSVLAGERYGEPAPGPDEAHGEPSGNPR